MCIINAFYEPCSLIQLGSCFCQLWENCSIWSNYWNWKTQWHRYNKVRQGGQEIRSKTSSDTFTQHCSHNLGILLIAYVFSSQQVQLTWWFVKRLFWSSYWLCFLPRWTSFYWCHHGLTSHWLKLDDQNSKNKNQVVMNQNYAWTKWCGRQTANYWLTHMHTPKPPYRKQVAEEQELMLGYWPKHRRHYCLISTVQYTHTIRTLQPAKQPPFHTLDLFQK